MGNKILFFLIFGILVLCSQIALADAIIVEDADAVWDLTLDNATDAPITSGNETIAEEAISAYNLTSDNSSDILILLGDEIIVEDAEAVWNLTLSNATYIGWLVGEPGVMVTKYADTLTYYFLENATNLGRLVGEPGVMVTKYADTLTYYLLENATGVCRLVGEPGVMVIKYADTFTYYPLENATEVHHLVGEPGVMVTKYADTFMYEGLTAPPFPYVEYFDTGEGTYPSIMGTHKGAIKPSSNITVNTLYTYPCVGTGGHTESIELYENDTLIANGTWNGYIGDYHNITIRNVTGASYVILLEDHEYNYVIITGSYPQIIHESRKEVTGGLINCTVFVDVNGKKYDDWIPAIRLWS